MKPIHWIVVVCAAVLAFGPPLVQALGLLNLPTQWAGLPPAILAVVGTVYVEAKKLDK